MVTCASGVIEPSGVSAAIMPSTFNTDLIQRLAFIERARDCGELTETRTSEEITAAFFDLLQRHYPPPPEPPTPPPRLRLVRRRQLRRHEYVEQIIGPDTFVIRKNGRCRELRLCSVRVPPEADHAVALSAAISQVLLMERVKTDYCCLDENGLARGVLMKLEDDPALPSSVNRLLVDCGYGRWEPNCRNECDYVVPATASVAGRTRNRFLRAMQDRGDRQTECLLGKY